MSYPIFRTPLVAITEIIRLMGFEELVAISLCSQRANILVKIHRPRQFKNICLKMISGVWPRAIIVNSETLARGHVLGALSLKELPPGKNKEFVTIKNHRVPIAFLPNGFLGLCLDTFWEDQVLGLKTIIDYVSDLFGLEVSMLAFEQKSLWSINWVRNRQEAPIKMGDLESYDEWKEEEFKFVLRTCKPTHSLNIIAKLPNTFRFTEPLPKVDEFYVTHGNWITVQNLMTLDSEIIRILDSKLTNTDVNTFLKYWITGETSRLEYFKVGMIDKDLEQILEGLETEERFEETVYQKRQYGPQVSFPGGYSIRRNDGTTAAVTIDSFSFFMVVLRTEETQKRTLD